MIELQKDELLVSFPEVHPAAKLQISFQRTLRIPDDNQDYPLPAGLGRFPLHHVDDANTPEAWRRHGGVFLPIHQSEALWISFGSENEYPMAVKVATGKINAVTGKSWDNALQARPQDYLVTPDQPWLDGFNVAKNVVRQFVARELGEGLTAEEQLTGEAEWGGIQLIIYPMKAEEYERRLARDELASRSGYFDILQCIAVGEAVDMGLAAGGRIRQIIEKDRYGIEVWDTSVHSRCFLHLLNSRAYQAVTGRNPPPSPCTPEAYAENGIPWFDYHGEGLGLPPSSDLAGLDGLAAALAKQGKSLDHNVPIKVTDTVLLGPSHRQVKDGVF